MLAGQVERYLPLAVCCWSGHALSVEAWPGGARSLPPRGGSSSAVESPSARQGSASRTRAPAPGRRAASQREHLRGGAMAAEGKLDLWKTVVAIGGGLIAVGASLMGAHLDRYGLPILIGGLVLVLLGLALAFEQQHEWRRPPRLPRGADCSHFPLPGPRIRPKKRREP